jgi:hypothetical protein
VKYNLTFLTPDGWKREKVTTEKTVEEIEDYIKSKYTKKIHTEPAKDQNAYGYLPLEQKIPEHPWYPLKSDKMVNYFKYTSDTYIEAEIRELKSELREEERKREALEKQGKKFLERLF